MSKRIVVVSILVAWLAFVGGTAVGASHALTPIHAGEYGTHAYGFFGLLFNNAGVLITIVALGLISAGTLGLLVLYLNGEFLGSMIHAGLALKGLPVSVVAAAVVPQGIFEISSYAIGLAAATTVSLTLGLRLFGFKTYPIDVGSVLPLFTKTILVSLICLILAAAIEAVLLVHVQSL